MQILIVIEFWDKIYEFRKIEKVGKNHVPTSLFLQAQSHFQFFEAGLGLLCRDAPG